MSFLKPALGAIGTGIKTVAPYAGEGALIAGSALAPELGGVFSSILNHQEAKARLDLEKKKADAEADYNHQVLQNTLENSASARKKQDADTEETYQKVGEAAARAITGLPHNADVPTLLRAQANKAGMGEGVSFNTSPLTAQGTLPSSSLALPMPNGAAAPQAPTALRMAGGPNNDVLQPGPGAQFNNPGKATPVTDPATQRLTDFIQTLDPKSPTYVERTPQQLDAAYQLVGLKSPSDAVLGVKTPKTETDTEQDLDAFAQSLGKKDHTQLTYAERQNFQADKAKAASDLAFGQHVREKTYDSAHADDNDEPMSTAAVNVAAKRYNQDGTLPPMGMGKVGAANRIKIMNQAAVLDPTAAIAANKANLAADTGSLKNLQKTYDASTAFTETLHQNFEVLKKSAADVVDTGSPFLNQSARAIDKRIFGSAGQTAFDVYSQSVVSEAAKILSSPQGTGTLTDSARKEMEAALTPGATLGQIIAAGNALEKDAANKRKSYQDQIDAIKGRIKDYNVPASDKEQPKKSKYAVTVQ